MQKIEAHFNKIPVIEAEFTAVQGVSPGFGYVVLPGNQSGLANTAGTLFLRDSHSSINISQLNVTSVKLIKKSLNAEFSRVEFSDKRIFWKKFTVTGAFNKTKDDVNSFVPETLKNGNPYKLSELIAFCLQKAGESISWQMIPAVNVVPRNVSVWY